MITAMELENFRSFGDRTRIPLAPITVVVGQNSAGKSSILHAVTVLKQTRESRDLGAALLPRAEGGFVDLGSYNELLFEHDTARALHMMFESEVSKSGPWHRGLSALRQHKLSTIALDLSFGRHSAAGEVFLEGFDLLSRDVGGTIARFVSRPLQDGERERMPPMWWDPARGRPLRRGSRMQVAECREVSRSVDLWGPIFQVWRERRGSLTRGLERLAKLESREEGFADDDGPDETTKGDRRSTIRKAIAFYSTDFNLESFIDRMARGWIGAGLLLDGFLPTRALRGRIALPEIDLGMRFGIQRPDDDDPAHRLPVLDVLSLAMLSGRSIEQTLDGLFPMGPWRRPPERWYIFTGTSPQDVGYQGQMLPDLLFRSPKLVEEANHWLRRLEIGYSLRVRPVGERVSDLFEVRLVDSLRSDDLDIALPDVGFGVSQVLPFIVQCLAARNRLISIEQPEVHVHPRLQAELGELIAASIREPYGHRFLIETHSEHLVLRLQRLVRDRALAPEDLSIVFVSRGQRGSSVQTIRLDSDGDFIDEWPGGFFPERLRELR